LFDISFPILLIGAIILVILGLVIAYKGFDLLKGFVRTTGAILGGIVFFLIGGFIGLFFGPFIAIAAAVLMGILGMILGAILAPTLLWLMLSIIVFVICFNIGANVAGDLGASDIMVLVVGIISGILGSWLFSNLARRALVGATSTVGGLMVGAGAFLISMEYFGLVPSAVIGIVALVIVSSTGYGANRGKKRKKHKKKKD
jgi:hypothetical protein